MDQNVRSPHLIHTTGQPMTFWVHRPGSEAELPDESKLLSMTKVDVRQKQIVVRTVVDKTISVVSEVGWDRKSALDVPFRLC